MVTRRRFAGGVLGLGLAIAAAIGISRRLGLGEDPDAKVISVAEDPEAAAIHPPDREARMDRIRSEGRMPALDGAVGWINTPPLTTPGLRGKVVVVDFWTYSCINWRRQLPYVRAWAQRYGEQGLVVIGVHSPEFGFEHDPDGVQRAARTIQIPYPIAIDSNYAIWQAFHNNYWPALYFIDAQGRIRHHQFGEGEYETSEMVIRQLLAEAGHPQDGPLVSVDPLGLEAAPDFRDLLTPETYIGYARTHGFESPGGPIRDQRSAYAVPPGLRVGQWALAGTWNVGGESAVLEEAGGRIVYHFHARDLHIVMGPARAGSPVRFRVRIDGRPPGDAHGTDVDDQGNGTITDARLYQLIRQPAPVRDREFEIELLDSGAELFSFTFG
jgi:thiol-disulfide isomerase/thioredoxin